MLSSALSWISRNVLTLLVAFILALVVWVSAVVNADPNQPGTLERKVQIEYLGLEPRLKIINDYQQEVDVSLEAPLSVWQQLNSNPELVKVMADLSSLQTGEHDVELKILIGTKLVRNERVNPTTVHVVLEEIVSQTYSVTLTTNGSPPVGYLLGDALIQPAQVTISGPASMVGRVRSARVQMDLSGVGSTITRTLAIAAVDAAGRPITDLTIAPSTARVVQPVSLQGGYRNVIVKVVTSGLVANGYRLTNYFASPASLIVFSENPRLVEALPGYIETEPLDLTNAEDDFEALLELALPAGITAVSGPKVLVQVSIAAIESSLNVSVPVEIRGLGSGLEAKISPSTVDIIVSGPVPALRDLAPQDIQIIINLTGFEAGTYQVIPVVDFLPTQLQKVSLLPATVEVTLVALPTPTLSPTPARTPTPTRRP